MTKKALTRRDFLQKTLVAGAAITGLSSFQSCSASGYDAKGLPTVLFGSTGVRIPRMAIGLGSRFCSVGDEEKSLEILTYALDNGIYYWDTAHSYIDRNNNVVSEERAGKILKNRRQEIFLSTKTGERDADAAMRQVELSLERLQTDRFDNLMIHSVGAPDDVDAITRKGGVLELLYRLKEQGITRFIGFSSHSNAEGMKLLIERGDFDTVLFAMNQEGNYSQNREELALPAARQKQLGIMLMKVVRPKETVANVTAPELIRFGLSMDGPAGMVVGMDSVEVVRSNVELARNFKPMTTAEQAKMANLLSPFFNNGNLEWSRPEYRDGHWG
jgi:uncharacterized protein